MEALQRMVSRRISEHSYKRNAKRLVAEDCGSDVDFSDKTQIVNLNLACDVIYDAAWSVNDMDRLTLGICSPTSSSISSPCSLRSTGSSETTPVTTPATPSNDDSSRTDRILQKVSMAVRRRLPMSNAFASAQHNSYRISALGSENDLKWNRRCAHSSTNKQVKPKLSGTMIDHMEVYSIGRRHRLEHQQLLSEDYDEE